MRVISAQDVEYSTELYKIVDFLNKNLKDRNIVFGLSKKDESTMAITIYDSSSND